MHFKMSSAKRRIYFQVPVEGKIATVWGIMPNPQQAQGRQMLIFIPFILHILTPLLLIIKTAGTIVYSVEYTWHIVEYVACWKRSLQNIVYSI